MIVGDSRKALLLSRAMFERLGCRDYARFDYRADAAGRVKLLEVNPNPGWCWDGHLARMAEYAGMSYAEMLGDILAACAERQAPTTRRTVSGRAA